MPVNAVAATTTTKANSNRLPVKQTTLPYQELEYVYSTPLDFFTERAATWQTEEIPSTSSSQIESTYQALDKVPGIQSRDQGAPAVSIRGSVAAGRVLTLYNGIPLNSGDGFGAPDLLIPKEMTEKTFVIKGPSSVFYGASALAGAVNHLSVFHPYSKIELQGSSVNSAGVLATTPLAKSKNNQIQSSLFLEGGPRNFYYLNSQSGEIDLRENNQRYLQRATLSGRQTSKSWEFREELILAHDQGTTPGPIEQPQVTDFENWAGLASLSIGKNFGDGWSAHSKSSAQGTDSYFDDEDNDLPDSSMLNHKFMQSLSLKKTFSSGASAEVFGDYTFFQLDSEIYPEILSEYQTDVGTIAILPTGQFLWQGGLRYLTTENIAVPSLGLTRLWPKLKGWINYSEGYRSPSLADRYAEFPTFTGNPNLQPERSRQIEVGVGTHQPEGFQWSTTAFATYYSDFIQFFSIDEQSSTMKNIGSARIVGGEAEAGWRYKSWQLMASSAVTIAKNTETNEDLLLTPTFESSLSATKRFKKLAFGSQLTYWGESLDENQGEQVILDDGFGLDFNVEFQLNEWKVSAALLNSLDQPRESKFGFPEPQRRLVGKLTRFF